MGPRKKPSARSNDPLSGDKKARSDGAGLLDNAKVPDEELLFAREYWTGDSRDGVMVNGEGYHYYRMTKSGKILEAYEFYEMDDGRECVSPLPEMLHVHWINDLGFEDFEALDMVMENEFSRIKDIAFGI